MCIAEEYPKALWKTLTWCWKGLTSSDSPWPGGCGGGALGDHGGSGEGGGRGGNKAGESGGEEATDTTDGDTTDPSGNSQEEATVIGEGGAGSSGGASMPPGTAPAGSAAT
jgi:hypothetical protein